MDRQKIVEKIKSQRCIIDAHTHIGIMYKNFLNYSYPYCLSFEDLVVRMKYLGINYSVIFPMYSSYYAVDLNESKTVITTEEFSKFPYEIENQSLLKEIYEIFPEYSSRAIPFLMFDPSRKTKEQAELFEVLYKKYPVFGLKTCTTYIQSFVKDLETKGKPILDSALKYDLPITIHSSYDKNDPWAQASDIIEIAKNYPEIRICLAHSARFIKKVLDKAAELTNCYVDVSAFDIHCQLARENLPCVPPEGERVDADYNNPGAVIKKLVKDYPDTIIWGTDTPYNYFIQKFYNAKGELTGSSLKSSFDKEIKILKELTDPEIEKISYQNSIKYLFG